MTGNSEKLKGESLKVVIFANFAKNAKNASVLMGIGWFAKVDANW